MSDAVSTRKVQTLITTVTAALLAWVGVTVHNTALAVARLEEKVNAIESSRELYHIERRLDQHDDRLENITARLRIVENNVHD